MPEKDYAGLPKAKNTRQIVVDVLNPDDAEKPAAKFRKGTVFAVTETPEKKALLTCVKTGKQFGEEKISLKKDETFEDLFQVVEMTKEQEDEAKVKAVMKPKAAEDAPAADAKKPEPGEAPQAKKPTNAERSAEAVRVANLPVYLVKNEFEAQLVGYSGKPTAISKGSKWLHDAENKVFIYAKNQELKAKESDFSEINLEEQGGALPDAPQIVPEETPEEEPKEQKKVEIKEEETTQEITEEVTPTDTDNAPGPKKEDILGMPLFKAVKQFMGPDFDVQIGDIFGFNPVESMYYHAETQTRFNHKEVGDKLESIPAEAKEAAVADAPKHEEEVPQIGEEKIKFQVNIAEIETNKYEELIKTINEYLSDNCKTFSIVENPQEKFMPDRTPLAEFDAAIEDVNAKKERNMLKVANIPSDSASDLIHKDSKKHWGNVHIIVSGNQTQIPGSDREKRAREEEKVDADQQAMFEDKTEESNAEEAEKEAGETGETKKHTVTAADLEKYPEWKEQGVEVGQEIEIPKDAEVAEEQSLEL